MRMAKKKVLPKRKKRKAKAAKKEPTTIGVFNEAIKAIDKLDLCSQQRVIVKALCGFYGVSCVD